MVFQNAPATFDRIVFAVIRWIVHQTNPQIIAVGKLHQPLDELRAAAGQLWTLVEIDHQLADVPIVLKAVLPPLLQTIRNKVTRLTRRSKDNR